MIKKFLAYLLTVSVLLSMLVVNVSAANEEVSAERVTKFENAVTLLTKIGAISEEDAYKFDSEISKGKFVDIMSKIVPVSDGSLVPVFQDVPETHEYFKVIQGFAEAGYINGHAGFFEPDRDITYNEALYIAMNTMGYKDFMTIVGAYPVGGWNIADQLDIKMRHKGAVAGDIFYMLYQALTTDMLKITGMKKDAFVFSTENSETLLEKYLEMEATEGVLYSNGQVSLVSGVTPEDDTIIIDSVSYNTEDPCEILAGSTVDAFYYADSNDLVCVLASDKNEIIEIDSDDIEYYKEKKYIYRVDGAKKTLKVQDTTDVVVNNVLVDEIVDADMAPVNGKVIAIDNGKGAGYDVLYVKSYVSFVAKAVISDDKTVTIKADSIYGLPTVVASIEKDVPAVYDADGNRGSIEDVTIGAVISVMGNVSGKELVAEEIVISKAIVTGTLTTIASGKNPYLIIEDEKYFIAASIADKFLSTISPQMDMTFFVDFMGNIVGLDDAISGSMAYGYLRSARMGENEDGDDIIIAEIFSEIGAIIKYPVSNKKLYIDGKPNAGKFIAKDVLEGEDYLKKFELHLNELVRYDINNDRELYKIDFAEAITSAHTPTVDDRLYWSLDNSEGKESTFTQYYGSKKAFGDKVHVDEDTIIFKLPDVDEDALESEYKIIRNIGGLKDGRYSIKAYKLGKDMMYAKVVVLRELLDPTLSSDHKGNMIVTRVTEVLNEYEEPTYEISLLGMDGEKTYLTKTKRVGDELVKLLDVNKSDRILKRTVVPGDVVRCYLTEDETAIAQIAVCYSFVDNKSTDGGSKTDGWTEEEGTYKLGYVYAVDDKRVSIAKDDPPEDSKTILKDSDYSTYMLDAYKFFKVEVTGEGKDRKVNEITPATKSDLKSFKTNGGECSKVLAISSKGVGQMMFIFEE